MGDGDETLVRELHRNACEEEALGWMSPPLSAKELEDRLGPLWAPARRFGLRQHGKVRPIDGDPGGA